MIFGDLQRVLAQFGHLVNLGLPERFQRALVTVGTGRWAEFLHATNLVRAKRRAIGGRRGDLSAWAARTLGAIGLGRLDDVGGRRLGGVGGVLGKPGDLFGQLGDLFGQPGHLGHELGVLLAKLGVVLLKLCDPSRVGLFPGRFHRPLPVRLP